MVREIFNRNKRAIDRPWAEYPIGTLANAVMGGYWEKTRLGWKWCSGSTFPAPGGDATSVSIPGEDFAPPTQQPTNGADKAL